MPLYVLYICLSFFFGIRHCGYLGGHIKGIRGERGSGDLFSRSWIDVFTSGVRVLIVVFFAIHSHISVLAMFGSVPIPFKITNSGPHQTTIGHSFLTISFHANDVLDVGQSITGKLGLYPEGSGLGNGGLAKCKCSLLLLKTFVFSVMTSLLAS